MNLRLGSDFTRNCPGLVLGFTDWVIRLREGVKNWKWPRNKKGLSSGVVIKKGISHNGLFLLPLLSAQCDVLLTFSLANTPYFICVHVICWDRLRCIIYLNKRGSLYARFWIKYSGELFRVVVIIQLVLYDQYLIFKMVFELKKCRAPSVLFKLIMYYCI